MIEINPHQVLVAGITRQRRGRSRLNLRRVLTGKTPPRSGCGSRGEGPAQEMDDGGPAGLSPEGILQRETLRAAELSDPASSLLQSGTGRPCDSPLPPPPSRRQSDNGLSGR